MFNQQAWEDEFKVRTGISFEKFKSAFLTATAIPYDHAEIRGDLWNIAKWNEKDFHNTLGNITYGKYGNFASKLSQLHDELKRNPNTTLKPLQFTPRFNVLLLDGLTLSSQRDTHSGAGWTLNNYDNGVNWIGVGTDGTAESQSQTGLISAYGSMKSFDASGQRTTINQTSTYNMLFSSTDLTTPVSLQESALYNLITGGTGHARVQFPVYALTTGNIVTFQVNELMANG